MCVCVGGGGGISGRARVVWGVSKEVNIVLRNRLCKGPITSVINAFIVPGKPDAPTAIPFDDTSINVTFHLSSYGGFPTKFRVLVRARSKFNLQSFV